LPTPLPTLTESWTVPPSPRLLFCTFIQVPDFPALRRTLLRLAPRSVCHSRLLFQPFRAGFVAEMHEPVRL
jgi:hypothetical protein